MAAISPAQADHIAGAHPLASPIFKRNGQPRKYSFRYALKGVNTLHMAIASKDTANVECKAPDAGVTIYVAGNNSRLEQFPHVTVENTLPGVTVSERYAQGHRGRTGDKGLSSAAASCPTLNPTNNEVLRLSVSDEKAMKRLLAWYAGELI